MKLVKEFLDSSDRNSWLDDDSKSVYVRKGTHYHPGVGRILKCFDVASINVGVQRQGTFTKWFDELIVVLKERGGFDAIYVESVLNPNLGAYLLKRGMYETQGDNYFYLL